MKVCRLLVLFMLLSSLTVMSYSFYEIYTVKPNLAIISGSGNESGITLVDNWLIYSASGYSDEPYDWDIWFVSCDTIFGDMADMSAEGELVESIFIKSTSGTPLTGLNTRYVEASPSYSSDLGKLFFHSDRPGGYGCEDIYGALVVGGSKRVIVRDISNLGDSINTSYVDVCPFVNDDGTILIFASNRNGGYGGLDLWLSMRSDSKWSAPVNLGPLINTSGNEKYPFLSEFGLFWSSDGRDDSEGYDIYFTEDVLKGISTVVRLPAPINSQFNDWGLAILEGDYLVWSSDRPGYAGGSDIFYLELPGFKPTTMKIMKSLIYNQ